MQKDFGAIIPSPKAVIRPVLKDLSIDSDKWSEPIEKAFTKFNLCNRQRRADASSNEIENINEMAMFLAQCGHESYNFTKLEENLNYSARTLLKLFPKKTRTLEYAEEIASKGAQAVASFIYDNRADLGNFMTGDGWRYRGRGIIQLTGRKNYKFFGEKLGYDLLNNPDRAKEPFVACQVACAYWKMRGITEFAREGNVIAVTRKINGGLNGLDDREKRFIRAVEIINEELHNV